uniref:Integrase core domain containing protein n=1 Tax=Solanum tuberosum TaxID=4113 RepID=M1DNZ1_SOLTU
MGVGRHEVQLERVNLSLIPTHSTRESEWAKVEDVVHAASGCPRETHLIRAIHSYLAAHDLDNLSKSTSAEPSEEDLGTVIKSQTDASGTDAQTDGATV